jgi:hypothetical protein
MGSSLGRRTRAIRPAVPFRPSSSGEQHRLAGLQPQLHLARDVARGEGGEDVVIVDDAVLEDLDEGGALVGVGGLKHVGERLVDVDPASDESGAGAKREGAGTRGGIDRAERGRRAAGADPGCRRILPLGQAVDLVVEQQHLAVEVAAQQVHGVIAADAECITVAGDDPYVEIGIGELDPCRHRRRATVDGVEAVGLHVIGEAAGAADTRDEHCLFARDAEVGHGPLHGLQHGIIAAAGAPAHFLVARPVLGGGLFDGGELVHVSVRRKGRSSRAPG